MTDSEVDQLKVVVGLCAQGQSREAAVKWEALLRDMKGRGVQGSFSAKVDALVSGPGGGNIMAMLFYVFRESIEQQNEDKRYWITKLETYNAIGEALADYLKQLNEAMQSMNQPDGNEDGSPSVRRPVKAEVKAGRTVVSYQEVELASERRASSERRAAQSRLRTSKRQADDEREEIYKQFRRDPEQLRNLAALEDLLLARAREVYPPKAPGLRNPAPR